MYTSSPARTGSESGHDGEVKGKESSVNYDESDFDKTITYHYRFTLGDGIEREFDIKLDNKTLNLIPTEKKVHPKWTELRYRKCPNCTLNEAQHKFCPIAANLVDLVDFFSSSISYEEVDIVIETQERKYMKRTTLQRGLSSLIGIYMVTSGCPIMEKLKPMVRYHLPFATLAETRYRVLSMYILAQYFLHRRGKRPDWELKKLAKIYEDIGIVNRNFSNRLSGIEVEDASINALVHLDAFRDSVTLLLSENMLDEIELLFKAYFDEETKPKR